MILAILIALAACGNHAPKQDDKIAITECHAFPGKDNWYTCPEGKVAQIVHKEPDGTTNVVMVADEGRVFWIDPKATRRETQMGAVYRWSIADDDQDDGIAITTIGGRVTSLYAW